MNVGFVSLGCSKNLIDTEVAIGIFKKNNFKIVNDPEQADIIIVNTCGFIDSAKEEAISTILEMSEYKKVRCKYLIAMGCLVQRYYDELLKLLPEVDLFIKLDDYDKFWNIVEELVYEHKVEKSTKKKVTKISELQPLPMPKYNEFMERIITTGKNYAYLKIGEGCSNNCTYCAIPYIRGPFCSRPMEDIIDEANKLANEGIKELIVIAQDTTKYGIDIYGESKLAELLTKLSQIPQIKWIRFLYAYPEGITEELINTVATNKKIAKYFDIPIQHISNSILKKMNRKTSKEGIKKIIEKIKSKIPDVTLRTSLIVGFPGETQEDFTQLINFIEETKFDKLGAFMYSKEEGTPAEKLPNQIHGNTKKSRYNKVMKKQQDISYNNLQKKIGNEYEVLIESVSFDNKYFIGRTMQDVPEIDGLVYIKITPKDNIEKTINTFVKCKIIEVNNYDLIGCRIENS
jgi:ribosomal protein S12 methylthiotransferase